MHELEKIFSTIGVYAGYDVKGEEKISTNNNQEKKNTQFICLWHIFNLIYLILI